MIAYMHINSCVIGTDTEVGKTHTLSMLCRGLRALDRRVWVHKPVACGEWRENQASDGRILKPLADSKQDPALVCPLQFPRSASPHLAAKAAGNETQWRSMAATIAELKGEHDLICEGAGGLLAPLSTDGGTIADICLDQDLSCIVVTRPHLGTLNHTQLTVREARRQGLKLLGLVINYHDDHMDLSSLSISSARDELESLCEIPILAEIPYSIPFDHDVAKALAENVISEHAKL